MKSRIFKLLAILYTLEARPSLDGISSAVKHQVPYREDQYEINPTGPLNFLLGYLYTKEDITFNKRVYSPIMAVRYELRFIEKGNITFVPPTYNNDDVIPIEDSGLSVEAYNYMTSFAKAMMHMFLVERKVLSIVNKEEDSFYQFLTCEDNKKYISRIFAVLLLRSEGLPIALTTIENGSFLIFQGDGERIKLPLKKKEDIGDEIHYDAKTVLDFFINHAIYWPRIVRAWEEEERFSSGFFMYSPGFLLQSFIYELSDDAMLKDIIDECRKLLIEKMKAAGSSETGGEEEYQAVYEKCFIKHVDDSDDLYCKSVKELEATLTNNYMFPFTFLNTKLLPFTDAQPLRRISSNGAQDTFEELDIGKTYKNKCEMMIYSLLCCLLYDYNTKSFNIKHIPQASDSLKDFFTNLPEPWNISYNNGFYRKWSEVVADLKNDKIRYELEYKGDNNETVRNQLQPGWFNVLRVLITITGVPDKIEKLDRIYNESFKAEEDDEDVFEMLAEFISDLFLELSVDKKIEVDCRNITQNENSSEDDIYGIARIEMLTENETPILADIINVVDDPDFECPNLYEILISPWKSTSYNFEQERDKSLIANLVSNMIDLIINNDPYFHEILVEDILGKQKKLGSDLERVIDVNRFFLKSEISIYKKAKIIRYINRVNMQDAHGGHRHLLQFTSNLIAKQNLGEAYQREKLVKYITLRDMRAENYPNIIVEGNRPLLSFFTLKLGFKYFESLRLTKQYQLFSNCLKRELEEKVDDDEVSLTEEELFSYFSDYLDGVGDSEVVKRIPEIIGSVVKDNGMRLENSNWVTLFAAYRLLQQLPIVEFLYDSYEFDATFSTSGNIEVRMDNGGHAFEAMFDGMFNHQRNLVQKDGAESFIQKALACVSTKKQFTCLFNFIFENHEGVSFDAVMKGSQFISALEEEKESLSEDVSEYVDAYITDYRQFYAQIEEKFEHDEATGNIVLKQGGAPGSH